MRIMRPTSPAPFPPLAASVSHPASATQSPPSATNPALARLAIPYSASLPSLRAHVAQGSSAAAEPDQSQDHPSMTAAVVASTTPIARGPTPVDLQAHLYQSFLTRKTADVALRIRGTWCAIYRLHRVILIQAGYFQTLFTAGFAESNVKPSGRRVEPDVIDIVFDDPNITRPAFEICIARLYGGGPSLHVPPSLLPTATQPLTPNFPFPSAPSPVPAGEHPATPRFLLSLLATAMFLSLPAAATQALQLILQTVGPHTVVRYLTFARGKGIGGVTEGEVEPQAAVGLEDVAELLAEEESVDPGDGVEKETRNAKGKSKEKEEKEKEKDANANDVGLARERLQALDVKVSADSASDDSDPQAVRKEAPPASLTSDSDSASDMELGTDEDYLAPAADDAHELWCYYGAVSDKIGEAAACWLARWGGDVLRYEDAVVRAERAGSLEASSQAKKDQHVRWDQATSPWHDLAHTSAGAGAGASASTSASTAAGSGSCSTSAARKRTATAPSRFADLALSGAAAGPSAWGSAARIPERDVLACAVPLVWRRDGLSARWVRGLMSSDALFVKGERERYEMAKAVVEMRRGVVVDEREKEVEEREWEELFRTGIYYENMCLDDLLAISKDISPTTNQPFVPKPVLQSAHWQQDMLRHHITSRPPSLSNSPSAPPLSPSQRDKALGLAVSTAEVAAFDDKDAPVYPVPGDASMRIGDSTGIEGASMDQLFEMSCPTALGATKKDAPSTSEANFFGLQQQRFLSGSLSGPSAPSTPGTSGKYTAHPPFRFAVEFWDVDALKEKSRLHSHTVWYAGSLYNVYVQVVRKKGIQLGVYLHRQSSVDPLPAVSTPSLTGIVSRVHGHAPSASESHSTGTGRPSSAGAHAPTRPSSLNSPPAGYAGLPLSRSTTPHSSPNSPAVAHSLPAALAGGSAFAAAHTLPATAPPAAPQQPYRDPRSAVTVYFAIACASPTGASLTRFTSVPDVFSVSQSWGWKSSSLRTEEYGELGPDGMPKDGGLPGREVSLRATVLLGVV